MITLVIIGVIAALTIPNLMQKYTEQTTVKKVQKFYSTLTNAYSLAMKENGPASEWGITDADEASAIKIYNVLFKPYFKIAKDCGTTNKGHCIINDPYKQLNKNNAQNYGTYPVYKVILDDGAAIWGIGVASTTSLDAAIYYDVNGINAPNQFGRDTFQFIIKGNKIFPTGIQSGEYSWVPFNSSCRNITKAGNGCTAWIIYKGNMDYLHCDLTWDKNSCKDK